MITECELWNSALFVSHFAVESSWQKNPICHLTGAELSKLDPCWWGLSLQQGKTAVRKQFLFLSRIAAQLARLAGFFHSRATIGKNLDLKEKRKLVFRCIKQLHWLYSSGRNAWIHWSPNMDKPNYMKNLITQAVWRTEIILIHFCNL